MAEPDDRSVTLWIGALKAGDESAAAALFERYFARFARLAERKLTAAGRLGGVDDHEDAALSAFKSFCVGAREGRFARLDGREDLEALMWLITTRKAVDQIRRKARRHEVQADEDAVIGAAEAMAAPELGAILADEYRKLLEQLGGERCRRVVAMRAEGRTREQIASALGCSVKTVSNDLKVALARLERLAGVATQEPRQ